MAERLPQRHPAPPLTLLFICTHNRCRSILCEAIARHMSDGHIAAFSAGSQPAGVIHPDTLRHLEARGIGTAGLRSESWDAFDMLSPDAVITVCDSAAGEQCPLWFADTVKVHWGLPDPSSVDGTEEQRSRAFAAVIDTIERRIGQLMQVDAAHRLSPDALRGVLESAAREGD